MENLKKRREFLAVARGQKRAQTGLVLQALPVGEKQSFFRVGFTVTRKVGKACVRNRARRRLKEAARRVLPVHGQSGYDYVLVGRAKTLTRPFPCLLNDLQTALRQVHEKARTRKKTKPPTRKRKTGLFHAG